MKYISKTAKALGNTLMKVEIYDSAEEVVATCERRNVTSSSFTDMSKNGAISESKAGVKTYEEAKELMRTGYQPIVDTLKKGIKADMQGQGKRISFHNDVVGYAPIVPLALQGVPTAMQNSYMKPIKAKVLNIYYDMTASWSTKKEDILKAGQELLAAIMELEMQGYKFNLYAVQEYYDCHDCDMLCTKVKSSNTPLDLKRISFALTHPAYFRVIGFDWYSKAPNAKYKSAYGHALGYAFPIEKIKDGFKEVFGENCVVFSASLHLKQDADYYKQAISNCANNKEDKQK